MAGVTSLAKEIDDASACARRSHTCKNRMWYFYILDQSWRLDFHIAGSGSQSDRNTSRRDRTFARRWGRAFLETNESLGFRQFWERICLDRLFRLGIIWIAVQRQRAEGRWELPLRYWSGSPLVSTRETTYNRHGKDKRNYNDSRKLAFLPLPLGESWVVPSQKVNEVMKQQQCQEDR